MYAVKLSVVEEIVHWTMHTHSVQLYACYSKCYNLNSQESPHISFSTTRFDITNIEPMLPWLFQSGKNILHESNQPLSNIHWNRWLSKHYVITDESGDKSLCSLIDVNYHPITDIVSCLSTALKTAITGSQVKANHGSHWCHVIHHKCS